MESYGAGGDTCGQAAGHDEHLLTTNEQRSKRKGCCDWPSSEGLGDATRLSRIYLCDRYRHRRKCRARFLTAGVDIDLLSAGEPTKKRVCRVKRYNLPIQNPMMRRECSARGDQTLDLCELYPNREPKSLCRAGKPLGKSGDTSPQRNKFKYVARFPHADTVKRRRKAPEDIIPCEGGARWGHRT